MFLSRREFLASSALAAGSVALGGFTKAWAAHAATLRDVAAAKGIYYGTCVDPVNLNGDPAFGPAVARECNIISTGNSTKWRAIWPAEDRWDFSGGKTICAFAEKHKQKVRGHTLIWHGAFPSWAEEALKEGRGAALMEDFIQTTVGMFKNNIGSWDVVNEAIMAVPKIYDGEALRDTPWRRALGDNYIDRAFRLAAEADPKAQLVYNDYYMEHDERKADAVIALVRRLKDKNVPLHAVGLQGHLDLNKSLTPLKRFCQDVKALGLDLLITELDVFGPPDFPDTAARDREVADKTREFLDIIFSVAKPKEIVTWGLTDRHSWLTYGPANPRNPAGKPIRGLPLDENYTYKPMWYALYDCLMKA